MAIFGEGGKNRSDAFRNATPGGEVCLEEVRLFRGWQFFVEEKINDVFWSIMGEFCDGITAVVNAFCRGHERGTTGTNRHAS
jgi:hypothetical protein